MVVFDVPWQLSARTHSNGVAVEIYENNTTFVDNKYLANESTPVSAVIEQTHARVLCSLHMSGRARKVREWE